MKKNLILLSIFFIFFFACSENNNQTTNESETKKEQKENTQSDKAETDWLSKLETMSSEELDKWLTENQDHEKLLANRWLELLKEQSNPNPEVLNLALIKASLFFNKSCKFLAYLNSEYFNLTTQTLSDGERKNIENLLMNYNQKILNPSAAINQEVFSQSYPKQLMFILKELKSPGIKSISKRYTSFKNCKDPKDCIDKASLLASQSLYETKNLKVKVKYYDPTPLCLLSKRFAALSNLNESSSFWVKSMPEELKKDYKPSPDGLKFKDKDLFLTPFESADKIKISNPILKVLKIKRKIDVDFVAHSSNFEDLMGGESDIWLRKLETLHTKEAAFKINPVNSRELLLSLSVVFARSRNFNQATQYLAQIPELAQVDDMIRRLSVAFSFEMKSMPKGG